MKAKRNYYVTASSHFYKVGVHTGQWSSSMRIRQFVVVMFRKLFGGREPNFHYHIDGNLAGARDGRGKHIYVDQINWFHRFNPGATTMRRPLCPVPLQRSTNTAIKL